MFFVVISEKQYKGTKNCEDSKEEVCFFSYFAMPDLHFSLFWPVCKECGGALAGCPLPHPQKGGFQCLKTGVSHTYAIGLSHTPTIGVTHTCFEAVEGPLGRGWLGGGFSCAVCEKKGVEMVSFWKIMPTFVAENILCT